ncbi:MAG TPA: helix-turn-helix domain-containing protein [Candidatus Acidoferrales bacterium]|nr:helix-turn-helix domain-containing protein [Candidatus Acidoferrales bacterium]
MRDKESDIKALVDLGISRTQAKVYLTLIERGTSTIRNAANYAGVARPDTYRAMIELKESGFVEMVLSSPATYKPIPLSETISMLMAQKQKEMATIKENSVKLLKGYENKIVCNDTGGSEFILVPKGVTYLKKCITALESAKSSIDIMTSFKRFNQTILPASDSIIRAANRGVKVRFIVDQDSVDNTLSKVFSDFCKNSSCNIKRLPTLPQAFIAIYDKTEFQMATSTDEDFTQEPILWSNNPALLGVIRDFFDTIWFKESVIFESFEEPLKW